MKKIVLLFVCIFLTPFALAEEHGKEEKKAEGHGAEKKAEGHGEEKKEAKPEASPKKKKDKNKPVEKEQETLRDICRRDVAGEYLNLVDQKRQAIAYRETLEKQNENISKEMVKAQKDLKLVREKNEKEKTYDAEGHQRVIFITSKLNSFKQSLDENMLLLVQAKDREKMYVGLEEKMRNKVERVFNLKQTAQMDQRNSYPFVLEYRDECSQYRYSCSLPPETQVHLKKILIDDSMPLSCKKFLDQK